MIASVYFIFILKLNIIKKMKMKPVYIFFTAIVLSFAAKGQSLQDKDQVEKIVIAFQNGFNDGGFKNAEGYTTKDWIHINPFGGITKGRDSVLADVRNVHQRFLKGVTMKVQSIEIVFPGKDMAVAIVAHKMDNYTTPDGVLHANETHVKTYVMVKKNKKWLLAVDQNTIKPN
jgi:uncharacterized protein (TIGR02246 family)